MKQRSVLSLLLLLVSAPASSAPTISMNWGSCTGPINQANTGSHVYSLYVSVVGIDRPHSAFQVDAGFGTGESSTPDAWVYDVNEYGELAVPPAVSAHPDAEMSQVCPALNGGLWGLFMSVVRFRPQADTAFPWGTMQFHVAHSYPAGVTTFDPNQRYFIARVDFDHSTSVEGEGVPGTSRGGFEQSVWFRLKGSKCNLLGLDGIEYPLDSGSGEVLATFGGGATSTPATATTWGQIKSQYRR